MEIQTIIAALLLVDLQRGGYFKGDKDMGDVRKAYNMIAGMIYTADIDKPGFSFITGQKDVAAAGTAEQLPDVPIPAGVKAIIMAKPGNAGDIYLGNSKANTESATVRFDKLEAGDSIPLQITNLNLVWIDASVNGEGVSFLAER